MKDSCWLVIPARGGSKGISRKNLQKVGGVPLVGRSVVAARHSRLVDRTFVSTDDDEIAEVAASFGAQIVRRPANLASDTATSEDALLHAIESLESAGEQAPSILVFVQCTSPFVRGEDIDGAIQALLASPEAKCAISVSAFHGFVWKSAPAAGCLAGSNHEGGVRLRRQDRGAEYLENGAVYALRTPEFRRARRRFCGPVAFSVMPAERSIEIDGYHELEMARHLAPMFAGDIDLTEKVSGLVFDFDGVMTDNKVIVDEHGVEAVRCDRSDGMGIAGLRKLGLPMLVLSKERNAVVGARMRKLEVECIQGVDDKLPALVAWAERKEVDLRHVIYVGNDINDISCFQAVGNPVAVSDSHPAVLPYARIVLRKAGGRGAVREICDHVMAHLKK